ncbi:hypothetical protein Mal48_14800 [Thalassoglobus polymorphus]|uniref:Uncharacterized protein n=1 Tax=Thalassoglobus polymorphus TaxID=2527994 RepID=A0A517QL24_9PLAN|nr:hypothetical protein Mal48_14800 [Thalassoglobus polymorphus]
MIHEKHAPHSFASLLMIRASFKICLSSSDSASIFLSRRFSSSSSLSLIGLHASVLLLPPHPGRFLGLQFLQEFTQSLANCQHHFTFLSQLHNLLKLTLSVRRSLSIQAPPKLLKLMNFHQSTLTQEIECSRSPPTRPRGKTNLTMLNKHVCMPLMSPIIDCNRLLTFMVF